MTADPWKCGYCGEHYVVPLLARDCEAAHEREDTDEPREEVPQ